MFPAVFLSLILLFAFAGTVFPEFPLSFAYACPKVLQKRVHVPCVRAFPLHVLTNSAVPSFVFHFPLCPLQRRCGFSAFIRVFSWGTTVKAELTHFPLWLLHQRSGFLLSSACVRAGSLLLPFPLAFRARHWALCTPTHTFVHTPRHPRKLGPGSPEHPSDCTCNLISHTDGISNDPKRKKWRRRKEVRRREV